MSVKAHEPVCLDSAQDLYIWFDHFLGDQLQDEWRGAGVGSAVVVDQQTGGIVRLTTGATTGDTYFIDWQNIRSLHVDKNVTAEFRVKVSALTNIRFQWALRFDANNQARIRIFTGIGTNWLIATINGGASTEFDSGITADTDYHILRIECFPTGEVHFYIDGVETANSPITTNIPNDATDYLQPYISAETRENATKSMDVDYAIVRQER